MGLKGEHPLPADGSQDIQFEKCFLPEHHYPERMLSTAVRRSFRPSVLVPCGLHVVAIDDVQPVAVVLDSDGAVRETVSWEHLRAPSAFAWPTRFAVASEKSVAIASAPDGDAVVVDLSTTPATVESLTEFPATSGARRAQTRFSRSGKHDPFWKYTSHLNGTAWTATVAHDPPGGERREWNLGAGSISSAAPLGNGLAVAVRRAGKRPWVFQPPVELLHITGDRDAPRALLPSGGIDITARCWPPVDLPPPDVIADHHLPFGASQCAQIVKLGARQIDLTLAALDSAPRMEISFTHDSRPGVRCVRTDVLTTELGHDFGLSKLGIFLEEDLQFGLVPPVQDAVDGVLHV
ncbi:hypothetical protein [Saccharopolyspora taberi]|uniref:Uncharacterized protein n=1 Tax=Saccharopolyspora taberi TaxID=60895 RepID=A0ABN3VCH1_9PSEU